MTDKVTPLTAEQLKAIRTKAGLSGRAMARHVGRAEGAIRQMEAGIRPVPRKLGLWFLFFDQWLRNHPRPTMTWESERDQFLQAHAEEARFGFASDPAIESGVPYDVLPPIDQLSDITATRRAAPTSDADTNTTKRGNHSQ